LELERNYSSSSISSCIPAYESDLSVQIVSLISKFIWIYLMKYSLKTCWYFDYIHMNNLIFWGHFYICVSILSLDCLCVFKKSSNILTFHSSLYYRCFNNPGFFYDKLNKYNIATHMITHIVNVLTRRYSISDI
jgi:hypothetical protein